MVVAAVFVAPLLRASVAVDRAANEVRFTASVQPGAMNRPFGVRGHHAIVWREGGSAAWALFKADASDREVRLALDSLGGRRGENLRLESWTERENRSHPAPDLRVDGSRVEIFVEWDGSRGRVPLHSLLNEKRRSRPQLEFRYGGNQRFQPEFRSGCIVCLYSCPGGAIGNRSKTIRDWVTDGVIYTAKKQSLPKSGTRVTITLKLIDGRPRP